MIGPDSQEKEKIMNRCRNDGHTLGHTMLRVLYQVKSYYEF
jgi:hypothetical protein